MELLILVAVFGGFMFLMSRANKKMAAKVADQREQALEVGNTVVTNSGMIGTIVDIDGGVVTIESVSGDETQWLGSSISSIIEPPYEDLYAGDDEDEQAEIDGIAPRDSDLDR